MRFRRYSEISRNCAKNLQTNLSLLIKEKMSHLISPENVHNYEHGLKVEYKDVDQNVRQMELKPHEASGQIMISAVKNGDFISAVDFIDGLAQSMSDQLSKAMFAKLEEISEETGNKIDNKGQPISGDLLLQSLEMTGVRITKTGQVSVPQLVASPDVAQKFVEIQQDPEFQKKYHALLQKKSREAMDEELSRKSKFPKKTSEVK